LNLTFLFLKKPVSSKLPVPVLVGVLLTILPLMTTSLLTAWAISHEEWLRTWSLSIWLLITAGLVFSSSLAFTPPTFLALVYGYFLGWTSLPLLFGLNLGAIALIFWISRFFRTEQLRNYLIEIYPKVRWMLTRFHRDEMQLIFFTKLSPVLPFAVTNLFFAVAGARLKQVLTGGALGMIPRTILAVWAGREAQDIRYLLEHPNEGLGSKIVIILLIIASTIGIGYFFKDKNSVEG
jgi:uncharacterized membrane protein YdjX (TVP38/TMEM64 family)